MPKLSERTRLPDGLVDAAAADLHRLFPDPTLVHLPGRQSAPLFVTVLLHGNEVTGLLAVQRILRAYAGRELPRALSIFFANVTAARANLRRLPDQPDYNRVWPGTALPDCAEARLMKEVVRIMRERGVFASVDLHNNTGLNPHYACVNALNSPNLQLASLFSRTVVYFRTPRGTQSAAMTSICPAVTLECGKPGEPHGVEHAAEFVEACLHLSELPGNPVAHGDIHLFHTVAVVRIPEGVEFGFGPASGAETDKASSEPGPDRASASQPEPGSRAAEKTASGWNAGSLPGPGPGPGPGPARIVFVPHLDRMNFREMPAGTVFALHATPTLRLVVTDEAGNDVADEYFARHDGALVLKRAVMPSMLTLDTTVIRQDCLCYLMERLPNPSPP